jgi:uncharacterized damage-inducible protein DinB
MMSSRAEAFATGFAAVNDKIIATISARTDEQWRRPTASEEWTVGVVAHHIADVQGAFTRILASLAAGETLPPRSSMEVVHQNNARHAREFATVGQPETFAEQRTSGAAIVTLLRGLNDEQLDPTAGVFGGHELSVARVVEYIVIGHAREHLTSIRATIAD